MNSAAAHEPEWLAGWVPPEWFDRYAIRFEDTRLPKGKAKQTELIEQVGADGLSLLAALHSPEAPASLRPCVPASLRLCVSFHGFRPCGRCGSSSTS